MSSGWCTSTCDWRGTSNPWMALTCKLDLSWQSQAVIAGGLGLHAQGCWGFASVWPSSSSLPPLRPTTYVTALCKPHHACLGWIFFVCSGCTLVCARQSSGLHVPGNLICM